MNLVSRGYVRAASAFSPARLAVVLSLIIQGMAVAGEAPLTLDEAINLSLREAPQIVAAQASLDGVEASAPSASRLPDPEAIIGVDNLPINTVDRFSLTNDFMTMRKIGVMQTVPNGAKRKLRGERAARQIDLAQAQLLASRFDAARAAAEAWIACATSDQALKRLRSLRFELGLQADAARASLASGRGTAGATIAFSRSSRSSQCAVRNSLAGSVRMQRVISRNFRSTGIWARLPKHWSTASPNIRHSRRLPQDSKWRAPRSPWQRLNDILTGPRN